MKTQVAVNLKTTEVICLHSSKGRRHDFRLFKESRLHIHFDTLVLADTGYQGMHKLHSQCELPKKRSKRNPLTSEDKHRNQSLSKRRMLVENVIGALKRFKIIADRYRNRGKRFSLRFNLIAGIYNKMLNTAST